MLISIVTPTFKRPNGIRRAAHSIFRDVRDRRDVEFISVDNDPSGSALSTLSDLARESPIPLRFAHEPNAGVSNARNAAMTLARGDLIAFLDDDQEALPGWLRALEHVQQKTNADAVFGFTDACLEIAHEHADYIASLYRRTGPRTSGPIEHYYGMNNSLLVRATMLPSSAPFDCSANETGGEDDLLFRAAQGRGARYAWSVEARAMEWVEPRRANLAYALRRSLAYGQGPCETAWSQAPRDYVGLARHMTVGAAQALCYSAAAGLAFAVKSPKRMHVLDKAVRGVGKLIWWRPQRFYGVAHND